MHLIAPEVQGRTCFYTGMTTDDIYLYAACTEFFPGALGTLFPPIGASLFRILPGSGSTVTELTVQDFPEPIWYNGMVVMEDGSLLVTPSGLFDILPTIAKVTFTNSQTLEFTVNDWLRSSLLYFFPNGLAIDSGYLYYVGGQNLNRVRILSNGSPGIPVIIYQAGLDHVIDDIDIIGDWIAMAEWSLLNDNSVTLVHKTGLSIPYRIDTGNVQLSSVSIDRGGLFNAGDIIGTSFNQGGVYHYSLF